jgi:hypothetical protein
MTALDRTLMRAAGVFLVFTLHLGIAACLALVAVASTGGPLEGEAKSLFGTWCVCLPVAQVVYVAPLCSAVFRVRPVLAEGILYGAVLSLLAPIGLWLLVIVDG